MKEAFLLRFEPKRYLDSQGNLRLPESMRAYVGPSGYEMDQLDDEQRLADLGYLITRGWDFKQALRKYLDNHEEYESDIHQGLWRLLWRMRGIEGVSWLSPEYHYATGYQLLNLFIKDIWVYYELKGDVVDVDRPWSRDGRPIIHHPDDHGIRDMKWDMDAFLDGAEIDGEEIANLQKMPTEEWIRKGYGFRKEEE